MAEERDVPTLDELVNEIDNLSARLDKDYPDGTEVSGAAVMSELKNTFLPFLKDVAAATMIDIGEIQDIVDPVKITRAEADETSALLQAFAASRPTDLALQERIAATLELLENDDDDDEGEGEEESEVP